MAIPIFGHLPGLYVATSVALGLFFGVSRATIRLAHEFLDLLRDLREFRRGR